MIDSEDKLLTPKDAAIFLGVTVEAIFQFTKRQFAKSSGLRSLLTEELYGKTLFRECELTAFDKLLAGPWCGPQEPRPNIPKAILDHLRAESNNQCARCGSGAGVDTAHIIPWATCRSHHPNNLIRICSSCHREHDAHQSLSSEELKKIKQRLIDRTRSRLENLTLPISQRFRPPRSSIKFYGRKNELQIIIDKLQNGESIVVSGIGGIGKSEIVLQALNKIETERTILWFDIEQYRNVLDLTMALRKAVSDDGIACEEKELSIRLDKIQACIVFDGIEQSNPSNIDDFEDTIIQLLNETCNTQFILTSQVALYRLQGYACIRLNKLDSSASRTLLQESILNHSETNFDDLEELLNFCDGHTLALQFAGALSEFYGNATNALTAIQKNSSKSICYPDRKFHNRRTSLELCLETAYKILSIDCKKLLWSLSLSPAGLFTQYLENIWEKIDDPIDSLAMLRRWHFINTSPINDNLSRSKLLTPVRHFVQAHAQKNECEQFEDVVRYMVKEFVLMVAVLELNYDHPEDTYYVMQRYEMELPNFMNVIELARTRSNEPELVKSAVSIAQSLMRYFFVSRLPEQGAKTLFDAAEMSLHSSNVSDASHLAMQYITLASRSFDDALINIGIKLIERIEESNDSLCNLPNIKLSWAIAFQSRGDFISAELYAHEALKGYRLEKDDKDHSTYNDIASAYGILGLSLLSQKKYKQARTAYLESLNHERGTAIGVNRGQTLHQLGNCEAYLEDFSAAGKYYFEALNIFHFVNMKEYLSNAFSELGYVFLDTYQTKIIKQLSGELIDNSLSDIRTDILRALNPVLPLNHQHCIQIIRKLFGAIILVSLTEHGKKLYAFCTDIANSSIDEIVLQIDSGIRDQDEVFPIIIINLILFIGVLVAQGESDLKETGDLRSETTSSLLRAVCEAHDWAHDTMRLSDWLSLYFTRRLKYKGVNAERILEFVFNYRNDIEDYIDLKR